MSLLYVTRGTTGGSVVRPVYVVSASSSMGPLVIPFLYLQFSFIIYLRT